MRISVEKAWSGARTAAGLRAGASWQRRGSAGGALVVVVGLVTWGLWPASSSGGRVYPPTRARTYASFTACLVTGPTGITDAAAAPVWAGLEQASAKDSIQVRYQAVVGEDTAANATTFVNTLALSKCDLVYGVGSSEAAAVAAQAKTFPAVRFVAVGSVSSAASNLAVVSAGTATVVTAQVASVAEKAFGGSFTPGAVQ